MAKRIAETRFAPRSRGFGSSPKFIFSIALLVTVFVAENVFAGGFALSGVGSKAISMGGAFRGLADDWSAAYWNPAGLAQLEKSEFTLMAVGISPRVQYDPRITYNGIEVGYRNGAVRYPDDKTVFAPDAAGFLKLEYLKKVTAGLAVFVPNGLSSNWDLYNPDPGMNIRFGFPQIDHKSDLKVFDIHPAAAISLMGKKLNLGVGVSIQNGRITFEKTVLSPSGFPIPHENLLVDTRIKGDGWGYGANFGVLYKFSDKLQFGLSGRTGTTMKMSGSADLELYAMNNEQLKNILIAEAEASGATAAQINMIRAIFGSSNLKSSPNAKADIKTPADVGFGIAFKPSKKLTIVGQVDYTKWSSLDSIQVKLTGTDPLGQPAEDFPITLRWDNTVRFSAGAEYRKYEKLALRFGYYFDPSPIPDNTFSPLIPDLGNKNSVNIGAAYYVRGLEISYNFEYIKFSDRNVTELADVNVDGSFDNYPGQYKSSLYASHISLTYRF